MANEISVTQLFIYPVKSLAGISLENSAIDHMGLQYDRRWMLVTPKGDFMSQRKTPEMSLIKTSLNNGELTLSLEGKGSHIVPTVTPKSNKMNVDIWGDTVNASMVGVATDTWLSDILNTSCHMVYIDYDEIRQCDLEFSEKGERTGFADGFPILIVSEESLIDLNEKLDSPVDMRRFRPNIVIKGCEAFAEDELTDFSIGDISMKGVKICSRCPMPMVDPDLGERANQEPIATLSTYRKWDGKIFFGMNVIQQQQGVFSIGDILNLNA